MAIGKGSMARASKAVKADTEPKKVKNTEIKPVVKETKAETKAEVKPAVKEVKAETKKAPEKKAPVKKPATKTTATKKPVAKNPVAKKTAEKKPAAAVVTPTKQVMDMIVKDRVEVGDEMPVYFY